MYIKISCSILFFPFVQVNDGQVSSRLNLQECRADLALQEWHWSPETCSLSNPQTGGCLTAPQIQEHESIWLKACSSEVEDREGQSWSCSKKGLLTLHGKGLHLNVRHDSSKVFLSKDRGKGSKWRTLAKQTVCEETDSTHHGQNVLQDSQQTLSTGPRILTQIRTGWKMTMLLLSSLALLLGLVILTLNIYQNSLPGSPVPSERAPLTRHPMKTAQSPSIQRGEILVEWKDRTVTPLFETYLTD
uniref:Si:dkey-245n4.2 n=1 Tax=Sinocyclocheilus grahami TaxID=75366 RepID=A0A672RK82_SINGR